MGMSISAEAEGCTGALVGPASVPAVWSAHLQLGDQGGGAVAQSRARSRLRNIERRPLAPPRALCVLLEPQMLGALTLLLALGGDCTPTLLPPCTLWSPCSHRLRERGWETKAI